MKKKLKSVVLLCIIVFTFCMPAIFIQTVYAANDTANTVQTLQDKVSAAMNSRLTTYTVDYSGNLSTIQADINSIINNIYNADDYMHYTTKSYAYTCTQSGGVATIKFTFSYWITAAQADFVSTTITDVLSQIITPDMNDYQKEKAIHDWILTRVAYDTTLAQHSDYAGLVSPYKTVCQGYALLGYKMLNQVGIQTKIIEGLASNQAHAWNLVLLDGVWYHLDLTWDDPVPDVAGRVTYNYYNLTDGQIKTNHSWTKSYPAASTEFSNTLNAKISGDIANQAFYQDLYNKLGFQYLLAENTASNSSELSTKLQQAIQSQQSEITVRYTNKSTLAADLKTAITSMGNITSYSYSYSDYMRTAESTDVLLNLSFKSTVPINVTGISLSQSNVSLTLGGATVTLVPTIAPVNASNKNVIWTTSDPTVATVTAGVVKATGGGTATITATTVDGNMTATATVKVTASVTSVTLDKSTMVLKIGDNDVTLVPTISPVSATNKNVTWTSSSPSIATVDASGKVHAVAAGTAIISATTQDGAKVAKCTVTVPVVVQGISLNNISLTLKYGTTATLTPVFTPTNATIKTVTWSSSNTSIVTVSSTGVLNPIADGTATITVTSTDGGYTATCAVTVIHAVTGVTLDKTSFMLKIGDPDVTLTATVAPTDATLKDIVWTSSSPSIATVDASGKVHAIAAGTVTITATSKQDSTKYAKCTVTVPVVLKGISLNSTSLTLKYGTTATLTPVFTPTNATIKTVTWSSSNTSIVTVSSTGVLNPIADGTATITVTSTDGGYTATCAVTVIHAVTGVTLDKTSFMLKIGDPDVTLTATVAPTNATLKDIVWTSSSPSIATVDASGKVHAVAAGTVTITATSKQDSTKYVRCTVTVPIVVKGISLNNTSLTLKYGTTATLTPVFTPTNATIKTVTWSSSDTSIVTVSSTGVLNPVADGTATITVTSTDGGYTATCAVTVIHAVTGVTLDKTSFMLKIGDPDVTLIPTVAPTDATIKDIVWTSSSPSIATVDASGKVHAVAAGTAIISATTKDGAKVAKCTVTVPAVLKGISLNNTSLTLKYGTTATLIPVFTPTNATIKTVTWSSSNTSIVTVSSTGVLNPIADGTATITVTSTDGGYTATCAVTVIHAVTGVTLDKTSFMLKIGDPDVTLTATVAPTDATLKDIIWTSSSPSIATVDANGKVHAVAAGTVTITATSKQDSTKYAKCTVTVPVVLKGISLNNTSLTLKYGTTAALTPVFTPTNATIKTVTWSSSDTSVVTVSSIGALKPIADGTATITVTSTDGGYTATCVVTVIHAVTGVTLDKTSFMLKIGDPDVTLTPTVAPTDATIKDIIWTSSSPSIATVDANGKVHAIAAGTVTITATSKQDSTKYVRCTVTVPVVAKGISLNITSLTLKYGTTATLSPVFTPTNATIKTVSWSSSDTSVVTVSSTGVLKPIADGTATITVTSTDGGYTATCAVTVIHAVTGVTLDKTSFMLKIGDPDVTLTATVAPTDATIKDIVWTSSSPSIATVDASGKVHAVAAGTVTITATSKQDSTKYVRCTVTVPVVVKGISLSSTSLTLKYGTTATLTPVFTPTNATIKTVTWSSSDTSIVTVSSTGVLNPVADGTATITVTSTDGGYTATCAVTVIHAVTGVTLDKTSFMLKIGDPDVTLTATVAPTDATIKDIVWTSSSPSIATVDASGKVHAVAAGTVTITATSKQDSTKYVRCTVSVTIP